MTTIALPDYDLRTHTLDNGLRVVINQDTTTPIVAVNLWYDVGCRDEQEGQTGFAHLFEHLMFEGSTNVKAGEHFSLLQSTGATLNATTSFDRTNYYETVPSHQLDLALWLEADRMAELALTQEVLDNQRDVVKEEKRQRYDNPPAGTRWLIRQRLMFPKGHHYHHTAIGSMADLDAASLSDALEFHARWYGPDNAVISIVGDVDPADALARVEHFFGGIASVGEPPRPERTTIPMQMEAPARREVHDRVSAPRVLLGWRVPPAGTTDMDALGMATTILGYGRGSLLYRDLVVDRQLAQPSMSYIGVSPLVVEIATVTAELQVRDGIDPVDVEAQVMSTIHRLATDGPSAEDLARARALTAAYELAQLSDVTTRADMFSRAATQLGDAHAALEELPRALAVTAEEVREATARWLDTPNRLTLTFLPGEPEAVRLADELAGDAPTTSEVTA